MASTIFVAVWQFFPFVVISLLARLQTIDLQLYEAAAIDGANAWRRLRHITLPELRHVLYVIVLLRTFFMFTKFDGRHERVPFVKKGPILTPYREHVNEFWR